MRKIVIILSVLVLLAGDYVQAQEIEETSNKKSFEVSYASSGHTTKYTFEGICIDEGDFICVEFWEDNFSDGEWKYGYSRGYYFYYFDSDEIQIITSAGLTGNLLETNPSEWVTAFRKFAGELPFILEKREEDRKIHWKTGKLIDETERKKIIIPLIDDELEIIEGWEFPCIVHTLWGNSSYFEIKRRDGKYVIWDRKYRTINEGIEDYLQNDFFRRFYTDNEQWKKVWEMFVKDGSLQKVIDFINEIIDDEFLNSPYNETYG
jgi:hypothetical protein